MPKESSYYVSVPKPRRAIKFFRPQQPNNEIFPDVVLGMDGVHWLKFVLGCVAYRGINLDDERDLKEMILNPEWGAYSRCLLWAYEISERNENAGPGFYVARNWTYGTSAREDDRDFVSYEQFGDLLNDIVNTKNKEDLVKSWQLFSRRKGAKGELKEFREGFYNDVLGNNLADFPVDKFLREVQPESVEELESKSMYAKKFVESFLREFREMPSVQEKVGSHSLIGSYVPFVRNQMRIITDSNLEALGINFKDGLIDPAYLKPTLSERGYDAFLLLYLVKDTPLFRSFVVQTYLDSQGFNFWSKFLNMREGIATNGFKKHMSELEELMRRYSSRFTVRKDLEDIERIAAWWDFNQFEYFMERLCWRAYCLFLEGRNVQDILEDEEYGNFLDIVVGFLKSYHSNHEFYQRYLDKEPFEEHLQDLDNIKSNREDVLKVIEKKIPRNVTDRQGGPMFVGHDAFQRWSRSLLKSLEERR